MKRVRERREVPRSQCSVGRGKTEKEKARKERDALVHIQTYTLLLLYVRSFSRLYTLVESTYNTIWAPRSLARSPSLLAYTRAAIGAIQATQREGERERQRELLASLVTELREHVGRQAGVVCARARERGGSGASLLTQTRIHLQNDTRACMCARARYTRRPPQPGRIPSGREFSNMATPPASPLFYTHTHTCKRA